DADVLEGDEEQVERLGYLRGCQKKAKGAVPRTAGRILGDWWALYRQLHDPGEPGSLPADKLEQACSRRGREREALLGSACGPRFAEDVPMPEAALRRAIRSARGFFHPDQDAAFAALLAASAEAPEERLPAYQLAFLEGMAEASRAGLVGKYGSQLK